MTLVLGAIADDFTGAKDLANNLVLFGSCSESTLSLV